MNMSGYTKLFNSILASTVWREDDKTRIVWITLLAMSNKEGIAEGSIPGLADMAHVSIEDCESALVKLSSPDKYSRSKDFEGRRIETIDGGWFLLNHGKYRAKMSADERREYNRKKQQEHRQRLSNNVNDKPVNVNDSQSLSALSAHTDTDTDTEIRVQKQREESQIYPPNAIAALHILNEASGKHFRETESNLGFITARLKESGVDIDGVRKMIDRQCKLWKDTDFCQYLRPETLFNKTKFDSYYASKDLPILTQNGKAPGNNGGNGGADKPWAGQAKITALKAQVAIAEENYEKIGRTHPTTPEGIQARKDAMTRYENRVDELKAQIAEVKV